MPPEWDPAKTQTLLELYNKHKHEPRYIYRICERMGLITTNTPTKDVKKHRNSIKMKLHHLRRQGILPPYRLESLELKEDQTEKKPYRHANCRILEAEGLGIGWREYDLGDRDKCYLIPAGDMHGAGYDVLSGFLGWAEKNNARAVFVGDFGDIALKGSLSFFYGAPHPKDEVKKAKNLIWKYRHLIDGVICGNHDLRLFKEAGLDFLQEVCEETGVAYHSDALYLVYNISSNGTKQTYRLFFVHGTRMGRRIGGQFNAVEDLDRVIDADAYFHAHAHGLGTSKRRKVDYDKKRQTLYWRKIHYTLTGQFAPYEGYTVRRAYAPAAIGCPRVRLDGKRHDLHISI